MAFSLPPERIAALLGAPVDNVKANWPLIESELAKLGMDTDNVAISTLATLHVECANFLPQSEKYNGPSMDAYFTKYDGKYGNDHPGDGCRYRGRGFVQLTGRANYARLGKEIGVDLESNPEMVLDSVIAAQCLARFFRDRKIDACANAQDWRTVRIMVNGGLNAYGSFLVAVQRLKTNAMFARQKGVTA